MLNDLREKVTNGIFLHSYKKMVSDSPTCFFCLAQRVAVRFFLAHSARNCLTDQQDCGYLEILSWRRHEISEIESEDDSYTTSPSAVPKNRTLFQLIELQTLMSPRKCVPFDRFFSSVKTPNDRLIQKKGVFTHPKWDTMGI